LPGNPPGIEKTKLGLGYIQFKSQVLKKIIFTVTNDLCFDQRMGRICNSLQGAGFRVTLVGINSPRVDKLDKKSYDQERIKCWFIKGKLFYLEFNIRLFFFLLFYKMDAICAIDLDTILPVLWVSTLKGIPRIYDAHELFCEMKEVVSRPFVYRCWKCIERYAVPKFPNGYTVSKPIAEEFEAMYGVHYSIIRNTPVLRPLPTGIKKKGYTLYQGAVNEGRSFETLIPAMRNVDFPLIICGDGNFISQARDLVEKNKLKERIVFKGMLPPDQLIKYTEGAKVGITLFDNTGRSNFYSLANRFFDYMHSGIPQLCVNFPAYAEINEKFRVALLINNLEPDTISNALNNLLTNDVLYQELESNCLKARQVYNWQEEEKKIIVLYKQLVYS
jgi:glycosyltransferase involved in cell wall biosynthesis